MVKSAIQTISNTSNIFKSSSVLLLLFLKINSVIFFHTITNMTNTQSSYEIQLNIQSIFNTMVENALRWLNSHHSLMPYSSIFMAIS